MVTPLRVVLKLLHSIRTKSKVSPQSAPATRPRQALTLGKSEGVFAPLDLLFFQGPVRLTHNHTTIKHSRHGFDPGNPKGKIGIPALTLLNSIKKVSRTLTNKLKHYLTLINQIGEIAH